MKKIGIFIKNNLTYLVMLVATFIALTSIVALTFGSFYNKTKNDAITIGNMTVSEEARRIDNTLLLGLNSLQVTKITLEYMIAQGKTPAELQTYLVNQSDNIKLDIDDEFSGIYGVVNGVYIDGVNWIPDEGYNPYERPWYLAAKAKNGEVAIVSPYIDAQTHSIMISFSQLLSDGTSAISLDMTLDNIYDTTNNIQLNGNGYCFVIDGDGLIVAHRNEDEVGKNYLTDEDLGDSELKKLIENVYSNKGNVFDIAINGKNNKVYSSNIQQEWYVVLVVEEALLLKDIRNSLIRNIIISLVIFVLVGYFCTSNHFNRKKAIAYASEVRTDKLTGLNNRGEFDRFLSAITSGIPAGKNLFLMLMDADRFKQINDKYGHPEGDRALKYIASVLKDACRKNDNFCARYGGDEFVVLCNCVSKEEVDDLASEISAGLAKLVQEHRLPYQLELSYGYAAYNQEGQAISDLIDQADHELYLMKTLKKNKNN